MKHYLKLMRIKHYVKNVFVFIPLFFSYSFINVHLCAQALIAFACFSLTTSIVYIVNDIVDKEKDAKHPVKKNRPIASGEVSVMSASLLALFLVFLVVVIAIVKLDIKALAVIAAYAIMNLAYSFKLKNIALIDVLIISLGFIFRIYAGAYAIDVVVSEWLLLTTFALSLFLGFGKRYGEKKKVDGDSTRAVLNSYTNESLHTFIVISMTLTIAFYSLYTILGNTIIHNAFFTIPFVVLGLFRYYMLVNAGMVDGDPTEVVLGDTLIKVIVILYAVITALLIIF